MRMSRLRDEDGATAVLLVFVLVLLVGVLALSIDGGLLYSKFRQVRRASDAAALAAARSCGLQEPADPTAQAIANANQYASANVVAPSEAAAPAPTVTFKDFDGNTVAGCNGLGAGRVTVTYTVPQSLMFGPAVGISSPKDVSATATAVYGGSGGAEGIVPLMISFRNTDCDIPDGTEFPQSCHFWLDDELEGLSTFGIMNLSTWGDDPATTTCPGAPDANLNAAINDGWEEPLLLDTVPTYVCNINQPNNSGNEAVRANIYQQISHLAEEEGGHTFLFPVNSPKQQIPPCDDSATTCAQPERYAIIGFAKMTISVRIVNNNQAAAECGGVIPPDLPVPPDGGDFRCVTAVWEGWEAGGYRPGGGANFGLVAVALQE